MNPAQSRQALPPQGGTETDRTNDMAKRSYNRRSDEELIRDLQQKIEEIRERAERTARKDSAVLKAFPRLQKSLQRFAQLAVDNGREDVANSTTAFLAGLERAVNTPPEVASRNPRARGGAE